MMACTRRFRNGMLTWQPFSYQQSNGSCWITSVHNGLLYLLGGSDHMDHYVSRMFYVLTSPEGTYPDEAEILLRLVNENRKLGVRARIIEKGSLDARRLRALLRKRDSVLITDTLSGTHSILLIGLDGDDIVAFDPDWDNVRDLKRVPGAYACCPFEMYDGRPVLNAHFNARIRLDHFLKTRTVNGYDQRFVMGAASKRFVLELMRDR
ncbi:MAG: hypothetical protein GF331_00090 [Chitinivibrionales bacterium]|nr:hypothetical protein [Chitinivibrionales bacterium]